MHKWPVCKMKNKRSERWKWYAAVLTVLLWIVVGTACRSGLTADPADELPPARIFLPDSISPAGRSVRLGVQTSAPQPVDNWALIWSDAFGDRMYSAKPDGQGLVFEIPDTVVYRSGDVLLSLCWMGHTIDQAHLWIKAGEPEGVIETYAGARTLVSNSGQRAMIVGIPKDALGNVVDAGTKVLLSLRYPDAQPLTRELTVGNMVTSLELSAGSRTGKIIIGATAGQARSIEEAIQVTSGWPVAFSVEVLSWFPYADARQHISLRTDFIRDAAGNLVSDGTLIHFIVSEQGRPVATYRSYTSGGSAKVFIENPQRPVAWEITAMSEGGIRSNSVRLEFAPYVSALPVLYDAQRHALSIGPVTGKLGQMVGDDLEIHIALTGSQYSFSASAPTDNGHCMIYLPPDLPLGAYQARAWAGGWEQTDTLTINRH